MDNRNIHRPVHLFLENEIYFITSRTYKRIKYFDSNNKKNVIKESLKQASLKYNIGIFAWVVLDNHYHLLLKVKNKDNISKFIRYINARSSRIIKRNDAASSCVRVTEPEAPSVHHKKYPEAPSGYFKDQPIWYQYFDRIIRNEKDFFSHFNYIHNNPVKHGYVVNMKI